METLALLLLGAIFLALLNAWINHCNRTY